MKFPEVKMKKFIGLLSILLACTFLFACSNGNQAQVKLASKKVSSGLDKMISQVKKLEDVNSDKMDLTSLFGEDMDTSDGYHCYNNGCYYCENGNCYRCKDCPQNSTSSNTTRNEVSTGRRNVRRNIYPYREVLNSRVPTRNHMTQKVSVNLFAGNDYRATKRNLNLANGNGNYNDLRAACNNVCDLNKEYSNTKTSLINNCNQAKQLLERLKNGEAKLSDSDVKTLNSYYEVIKQCTNNISSCKSCKSTVNTIGKKKLNLASNSGSMTADYRNIYNCLDANCNTCNNANNSVLDLISFANKLLGEKQDSAMLGSNNVSTSRYNSARSQFNNNRNRYNTQNNQSKYPSQNGVNTNNSYSNNRSYDTIPYTRDIKTPQRYYDNKNSNTTSTGGTTISSRDYEKSISNNSTNATQNNSPTTIPATKSMTTNTQNSNGVTNFNSNNTTYTKNNAINNSNYSTNKSIANNSQSTYNSSGNYQNNSVNKNSSIYNNSSYNSNNLNRNNTTFNNSNYNTNRTSYNSNNVNRNNTTTYTNNSSNATNNIVRNNSSNYTNTASKNNTNYSGMNNYNQNTTNSSTFGSKSYGTNSAYNTTRNNPRVNYYAPTTSTLRTNTTAYVSNFEPLPLEPQQSSAPLTYGPKQVRA